MTQNHPMPNEENKTFETPNTRPETATEEIERVEEQLPDNGVAPEYRDEDRRKEMPDVDKVTK